VNRCLAVFGLQQNETQRTKEEETQEIESYGSIMDSSVHISTNGSLEHKSDTLGTNLSLDRILALEDIHENCSVKNRSDGAKSIERRSAANRENDMVMGINSLGDKEETCDQLCRIHTEIQVSHQDIPA
jgi:hypothetical protein